MTHRDKARAQALEYARSQGWLPPEAVERFIDERAVTRNEAEAGADAMRIADLERQNSEMTEDHGTLSGKRDDAVARCELLENALRTLADAVGGTGTGDPIDVAVSAARELLS